MFRANKETFVCDNLKSRDFRQSFDAISWHSLLTAWKDKNFNEVHEKVDKSSTYVEKDT